MYIHIQMLWEHELRGSCLLMAQVPTVFQILQTITSFGFPLFVAIGPKNPH